MEEDLIPEKVDLITLLRTFKKEGLENFIVIRKVKFEKIIEENENLKQAAIINDRLYKEVCNKNKELEEQNNNYKKYAVMMTKEGIIIAGVKFSFEDYIPKSLIKEIRDKVELEDYYGLDNVLHDLNKVLGEEK